MPENVFLNQSPAPENTPVMPLHTPEKNSPTPLQPLCAPSAAPPNTVLKNSITGSNIACMPSHSAVKNSATPFHAFTAASAVLRNWSHIAFHTAPMISPALWKNPQICAHAFMTQSRNPSFVFHRYKNAATSAAIAAMTRPTGLVSMLSADPTVLTAVMTFAIISSAGPTAATTAAIVNIMLRVPSSRSFSQSMSPVIHSTACRSIGVIQSEKLSARLSSAPFSPSTSPARLSSILSAISCVAPEQSFTASVSCL